MIKIKLTDQEKKELETSFNYIEVKVGYWIGGYRGFNWVNVPRGYELDITPVNYIERKREDGTSYTIRETVISLRTDQKLRGGFLRLESTMRKSQKRMAELENSIDVEELKKLIFEGRIHEAKNAVKAIK